MSARTVWKFTLDPWSPRLPMPSGAVLRHVHEQSGKVCVWAEVVPDAPLVERMLYVVGTGHPITTAARSLGEYIGTAHLVEGGQPIVLHVYDGGEA